MKQIDEKLLADARKSKNKAITFWLWFIPAAIAFGFLGYNLFDWFGIILGQLIALYAVREKLIAYIEK